MNKNLWIKFFKKSLLNLPSPVNISYWWNFGSLLGFFLFMQIFSGLFLSMYYCANMMFAFDSIIYIMQNIKYGWLIHNIHLNGASLFFICIYIHMSRGLYYNSFKLLLTWLSGVTIFIFSMMIAFLGYILPWGQMSFWGAMVITNLISVIPYVGNNIMEWIWGGFTINNATLGRFYSLHFILPFILILLIFMHLFFLHLSGSSNPLGLNSNMFKIPFHLYFTLKDFYGIIIMTLIFLIIIFKTPYMLSDPENFIPATPLSTPTHIQPEWYFLFAYAILRSIPNKMGGVIALSSSMLILYFLPLLMNMNKKNNFNFYPLNQFFFWMFINLFIMLTWLGAQPIEYPFIQLSQILSFLYFFYFISMNFFMIMWNYMIFK